MTASSTSRHISPYGQSGDTRPHQAAGAALWVAQILLALVFLGAGLYKLTASDADLRSASDLPPLFLRFIASCELLGVAGLILPGLLHIQPGLTPIAATGLGIIMIGAVVTTVAGGDILRAFTPLAVGLVAAAVTWGRTRKAPLHDRATRSLDEPLVRAA